MDRLAVFKRNQCGTLQPRRLSELYSNIKAVEFAQDRTKLICCQVPHGSPVFSIPYLPTNVVEPMRKPSGEAYLQLISGYWGCFQAWV